MAGAEDTGGQAAPSLEARISAIESREAIRDLVYRYALNVRSATPAACADLLTRDATFETRNGDPFGPTDGETRMRLVGREAIVAHITNSSGAASRVYPSISNLLIELADDAATATCLMSARVRPHGRHVHGEYRDSFRREGGRWRFAARLYTIFPDGGA